MRLVDMFYMDTVKILLWLFLVKATCSAIIDKDPDSDLKRTQSPLAASRSLITESTEENPHQYPDHYESNKQHQPEGDERYDDPQRRLHLNNEGYRQDKAAPYKDDEVPQTYKFGYEVKDEHEGHQFRHEQKDEQGNIQGRFGYRDAKGQYRQVDYVADDYGFRAKVKTNEAGVDNQNPANVEIQMETGNDFHKEYTRNADTGQSGNTNVGYHTQKNFAPNHYHRQPVESEPHGAHDATMYYHREPTVESKPHGAAELYHRQPTTESEPHRTSDHYHQQPAVENEPHSETEHYHRQPVVESEPHGDEYETKHTPPHRAYTDYQVNYHYPQVSAVQESEGYHQRKNDEPAGYEEVPAPVTHQYFTKERHAHDENEDSSEQYHEVPHAAIYRQEQKTPTQHYPVKSRTGSPSTYQYELEIDGQSYKYVKRPSSSEHALPHVHQSYSKHDKEYQTRQTEHTEADLHQIKLKEYPESHNLNGYEDGKSSIEENYQPREQRLILPQTAEHNYNVHSYRDLYSQNHEDTDQDHPNKETEVLKYEYNGHPLGIDKLRESKEIEPENKVVPVVHQYVQIIGDSHGSKPGIYNRDQGSNRHRHIPHEKSNVHPQQIVIMEPRNKVQIPEKDITYGEKTYQRKLPQSSLQSLNYNIKSNEHHPLQKAVLELNSDIYKQLVENKSPGQRIVAIPVNHINGGNAENSANVHPNAGPAHGVLHITLNGQSASSFNLNSVPMILRIGNGQHENSRNTGSKYQAHIPSTKNHNYPQSSSAPIYKANAKLYGDKENSNWIPMTTSWNQIRRKSPHEDDSASTRAHGEQTRSISDLTQIPNGEAFKFLQAESSNRPVDLQKQPPKITISVSTQNKKVNPGIYIISSSAKLSQSKDSKPTKGHTLLRLKSS